LIEAGLGLQWAWEAALAAYLVLLVILWRRPLPQVPDHWSFEALNLLLAQLLVGSLYALLEAAQGWHGLTYGAVLFLWASGWWLGYWGLRWSGARGDRLLLPLACLLSGLGWVIQLRLDPSLAFKQACWTLVGVLALLMISASLRRIELMQRATWPLLALASLLQLGLLVFGEERNGAALWYQLGPVSFQPIEIVKVIVVCLLAIHLSRYPTDQPISRSTLARLGSGWLLLELLLVAQRDLGQALLFHGLFLSMLYLTTGRIRWVVGLLGLSSLGALAAYLRFGHVRVRVEAWLDPLAHYQDSGYQISEALFALAWGGWGGTGLGQGQPWRIPEASTDFIYIAWCEEMGLVGGLLLWCALCMFLLRTFLAGQLCHHRFEQLLGLGLASLLTWQTCIVLWGTLKLMPMTGITLPFLSYGGSSLLSNFVILALLQRLTQRDL